MCIYACKQSIKHKPSKLAYTCICIRQYSLLFPTHSPSVVHLPYIHYTKYIYVIYTLHFTPHLHTFPPV